MPIDPKPQPARTALEREIERLTRTVDYHRARRDAIARELVEALTRPSKAGW